MLTVIERARRYVAKCPPAISGQGGHDATYHVAALLVNGFALGETEALMLLREWNGACVPPWSEVELIHKIKSTANATHCEVRGYLLGSHTRHAPHSSPLPNAVKPGKVDPTGAAKKFLKGFRCGEAELLRTSPVRPSDDPKFDGAVLIDGLYSPGELVNFVTEYLAATDKSGAVKACPVGRGITLERDAVLTRFRECGSDSDKGGAWLRMNPVDGRGIADVNVTAFRFALLESDKLPLELQLSVFAKLPLPVAALLASGGRSVHAWVKVDARDAEEYRVTVDRMLAILERFGVDGKNKNPSRLSRLPGARRSVGAVGDGVQRLLYLNPHPDGRSIL